MKTFEGHTSSVLRAIFITRGMQIASRWVGGGKGWMDWGVYVLLVMGGDGRRGRCGRREGDSI